MPAWQLCSALEAASERGVARHRETHFSDPQLGGTGGLGGPCCLRLLWGVTGQLWVGLGEVEKGRGKGMGKRMEDEKESSAYRCWHHGTCFSGVIPVDPGHPLSWQGQGHFTDEETESLRELVKHGAGAACLVVFQTLHRRRLSLALNSDMQKTKNPVQLQ